jgi:diguanylate cyclase (GGDEF)-like protein
MNQGIVVLDRQMNVRYWNQWMARHTGVPAQSIVGGQLFDHYPSLDSPKFHRNRRAVLAFGTYAYFSQKLHGHLFECKLSGSLAAYFPFMQQSCTLGPIREEDGSISGLYIVVQDVTELALYEQRMIEMNTRDPLTGAANRRHLDALMQDEMERAMRYDRPLSLIMVDVDHFKSVNDRWGHTVGDGVLQTLSRRLAALVRNVDCLARFGGEEFCCLLPETPLAAAGILAERFRDVIAATPFDLEPESIQVTISLGVAQLASGDDAQALISRADQAMYQAKHSGRNCVRLQELQS